MKPARSALAGTCEIRVLSATTRSELATMKPVMSVRADQPEFGQSAVSTTSTAMDPIMNSGSGP